MLMDRYKNIHFYTEDEAIGWFQEYTLYGQREITRPQGAAMQYYMSHFMYLPNTLIAHVLGRKPWHVNQTIQRLMEASEMTRVPVTMNESYQEHIEDMDDFSREVFGAKNPEFSMILDDKTRAWILWSAQKASGWFEDSEIEPDQSTMIDELLNVIGLPSGGWMADIIADNFKIDYHD